MTPNRPTPEGRALGAQMARLCDGELKGKDDARCGTCAFRAGDHLANNSAETLMTALQCAMERTPFWCHEADMPCAGWLTMRFPAARTVTAPWDAVEGGMYQAGDVIPLPDESAP